MAIRSKGWLLAGACAAAFAATALTADPAEAAFSTPESAPTNNTCSGGVGGSFGDCTLGLNDEGGPSPIIIKYQFDDGELTGSEINTDLFPSITGDEFTFEFDDDSSGTWFYDGAVAPDPRITAYGYCGGNECFTSTGSGFSGILDTSLDGGSGRALSNISFYDTGVVPLPAAAWMMIGGLGLMGGAMRKFRRPKAAAA